MLFSNIYDCFIYVAHFIIFKLNAINKEDKNVKVIQYVFLSAPSAH